MKNNRVQYQHIPVCSGIDNRFIQRGEKIRNSYNYLSVLTPIQKPFLYIYKVKAEELVTDVETVVISSGSS